MDSNYLDDEYNADDDDVPADDDDVYYDDADVDLLRKLNGDVVNDGVDNDSVNELFFIDDHAYTHGSVSLPL